MSVKASEIIPERVIGLVSVRADLTYQQARCSLALPVGTITGRLLLIIGRQAISKQKKSILSRLCQWRTSSFGYQERYAEYRLQGLPKSLAR